MARKHYRRRVPQAGRIERNQRLKPSNDRKPHRTSPPGADAPIHDMSRCVGAGQTEIARPAMLSLVMGTNVRVFQRPGLTHPTGRNRKLDPMR